MSESESGNIDGNSFSSPIKIPSEPEDHLAAPDPLLESGSFMAPNNGVAAKAANQNVKSKETLTPAAENNTSNNDNLTNNGDDADLSAKRARPDWLPANFKMVLKKRTYGVTVGTVDRYYIAPSGLRLRSKREVLTFLETGKRKNPSTPSPASEGSAPRSKQKTGARKKVDAGFKFDFKNPPEKVSWCLTYATDDTWSPRIGDWNIPLVAKQDWAAAFNRV